MCAPLVDDGRAGSINVSSILTGKLIAKIQAVAQPKTSLEKQAAEALSGAQVAGLTHVTARGMMSLLEDLMKLPCTRGRWDLCVSHERGRGGTISASVKTMTAVMDSVDCRLDMDCTTRPYCSVHGVTV